MRFGREQQDSNPSYGFRVLLLAYSKVFFVPESRRFVPPKNLWVLATLLP